MSKPLTEEIDVFCNVCRKIVLARVAGAIRGDVTQDMFDEVEGEDAGVDAPLYKIAFCVRCSSPFLLRSFKASWEGSDYTAHHQDVLYPRGSSERSGPNGVPAAIERHYRSAVACVDAGEFEAGVIMARKSLEALCRELGADKGTLQARLASLAADQRIEPKLLTWANELRLIGNDAAHELDVVVSHDDARDVLDFVEAILLYTFTLELKFEAFQQRRSAGRTPDPK